MAAFEDDTSDPENPFFFDSFLKRRANSNDCVKEEVDTKNEERVTSSEEQMPKIMDDKAKFDMQDHEDDDHTEEKEDQSNNPFSFKEFVRKDKRKAVYYNSKDDDNEDCVPNDSEVHDEESPKEKPPQNLYDIFSDDDQEADDPSQFLDMGNQASQGHHQGTSSPEGKGNQRRATSSSIPSNNRARGKAHRSAQSAINPSAPPIPPHAHSASSEYVTSATKTSPTDPAIVTPITATVIDNAAKGSEFVDFIYDYATKDDEQQQPERTGRSNTGTMESTPKPADRKQGRERARAHTHGHGPRKLKAAAAANKQGNTKSQVVVDYMDATVNSQDLLSPSSLSTSLNCVPNLLSVSNGTEVDDMSSVTKLGRERARAQSHGHRKKLPKKAPEVPPKTEIAHSVPEIIHAVAAENGHSIYQSPRSAANGPVPKSAETFRKEEGEGNYERVPNEMPDAQPIPDNEDDLKIEITKLRSNNKHLRQELADAKKAVEKDAKKIDGMEVEMRRLRDREVEDAKTLETMVHHVEANLKRTTERAVTAENTITKQKGEIKTLKAEITALAAKNKKLEEGTALQELKEKSHAASFKLATAAKEADATIKQMASGVETLKLLAETLACIDRISEVPKSFGTAL